MAPVWLHGISTGCSVQRPERAAFCDGGIGGGTAVIRAPVAEGAAAGPSGGAERGRGGGNADGGWAGGCGPARF